MTIIRADAVDAWRHLVNDSVQALVTSPPYWGLRSYGDDPRELGTEDLHRYLERLVEVFASCRHGMAPSSLAWVNIGDTAAGSGGAGGDYNEGGRAPSQRRRYRQGRPLVGSTVNGTSELAAGQWCGVPGRLAAALQDDGWRLRSTITWDKGRLRPESLEHANRPGVASEVILLLAPGRGRSKFYPERLTERGDVWHFPPATGRYKGPAPFPRELPRRCIVPSTDPGDLVLDPFAGSGTTLEVAERIGRRAIGFDLYTTTTEETP